MTDQPAGACRELRQTVLDEGLETLFDDDLGQHGIARLFESEDQLFTDGGRFEEGRLPEAFSTR